MHNNTQNDISDIITPTIVGSFLIFVAILMVSSWIFQRGICKKSSNPPPPYNPPSYEESSIHTQI